MLNVFRHPDKRKLQVWRAAVRCLCIFAESFPFLNFQMLLGWPEVCCLLWKVFDFILKKYFLQKLLLFFNSNAMDFSATHRFHVPVTGTATFSLKSTGIKKGFHISYPIFPWFWTRVRSGRAHAECFLHISDTERFTVELLFEMDVTFGLSLLLTHERKQLLNCAKKIK